MNAPPVKNASNCPPNALCTCPSRARLSLMFERLRVSSLFKAVMRSRTKRCARGNSSNLARNPFSRFFRTMGTRLM